MHYANSIVTRSKVNSALLQIEISKGGSIDQMKEFQSVMGYKFISGMQQNISP
jgi:hypothetical protein